MHGADTYYTAVQDSACATVACMLTCLARCSTALQLPCCCPALPRAQNGNWDEVSGEAFLRKLLSMPIEEAKFNTVRSSTSSSSIRSTDNSSDGSSSQESSGGSSGSRGNGSINAGSLDTQGPTVAAVCEVFWRLHVELIIVCC